MCAARRPWTVKDREAVVDFLAATAITAAGAAAGAINAVVGSGTLITFPTLLALGYPPVLANVGLGDQWNSEYR
ncbi:hypothetical protein GCM10023080_080010 [Streptomyces pseudoechinosporeus]